MQDFARVTSLFCDKLGTSPLPYPSFLLILTSRTLKTNLLICRQTYLKTSRNLLICRWEPTFSKGNILPICRRIRYHSIIKTYKYVAGTPSPPHQQVTYLSQKKHQERRRPYLFVANNLLICRHNAADIAWKPAIRCFNSYYTPVFPPNMSR